MTIDVLSFIFGVYDRLIFVQTIVSGYGITDRYSNQVIGRTTEAKQLKCDQDGSDRTVGNATEKGCHSGGCTDGWGKTDQVSHDTSECCSDAEGRNNLTTAETGTHGQCRKSPAGEPDHSRQQARSGYFRHPYNQRCAKRV